MTSRPKSPLRSGSRSDLRALLERGEGVAQFVRERRQEFVLRAISLTERLLGALSFADVQRDRSALRDTTRFVAQHVGGDVHPADRSVLVYIAFVGLVDARRILDDFAEV